jgi:hypothetical protein
MVANPNHVKKDKDTLDYTRKKPEPNNFIMDHRDT